MTTTRHWRHSFQAQKPTWQHPAKSRLSFSVETGVCGCSCGRSHVLLILWCIFNRCVEICALWPLAVGGCTAWAREMRRKEEQRQQLKTAWVSASSCYNWLSNLRICFVKFSWQYEAARQPLADGAPPTRLYDILLRPTSFVCLAL